MNVHSTKYYLVDFWGHAFQVSVMSYQIELLYDRGRITVFIRLTVLGAYYIFGPWEWALTQGGCLFEAGRILNFHHFQQVYYVYFATKQ